MAPRLDYYFRETATGLRRNGVVALAAMSTAFIALFLLGLALLIQREFNLVKEQETGNVQVAVYLNDPVHPDTLTALQTKLQNLSGVSSVVYWNKKTTCDHYDELFANQPIFIENVDCEKVIPTSLRVTLSDTALYGQVTAALDCAPNAKTGELVCNDPAIKNVADYRLVLQRLDQITNVLSFGVLAISVIMLVSAVALVANTLRMGMFARRKEIGIMRLVGATNWRIRVPYLIEGLVEALLGAIAAIFALFLVKVIFIDRLRYQVSFFPLIKNSDVMAVAPWILIAAVFVAVVAGTIGMRRFLDV